MTILDIANSVDSDEMLHDAVFQIGVFNVCQSTRLGVSSIQRVKHRLSLSELKFP